VPSSALPAMYISCSKLPILHSALSSELPMFLSLWPVTTKCSRHGVSDVDPLSSPWQLIHCYTRIFFFRSARQLALRQLNRCSRLQFYSLTALPGFQHRMTYFWGFPIVWPLEVHYMSTFVSFGLENGASVLKSLWHNDSHSLHSVWLWRFSFLIWCTHMMQRVSSLLASCLGEDPWE